MDTQGLVTAQLSGQSLHIEGSLTKDSAATLFVHFRRKGTPKFQSLDVNGISRIDTSGIAFLEWILESSEGEPEVWYEKCPNETKKLLEEFLIHPPAAAPADLPGSPSFFEKLG